jgi:SAM-dependent methyltransferase
MKDAVLVLGCGNSQRQVIHRTKPGDPKEGPLFSDNFQKVVTIDMDPGAKPTHLWNLEVFPWPVHKEEFDEVHAYEVLEHLSPAPAEPKLQGTFDEVHAYEVLCNLGGIGNYKFFFRLWQEIWNCLKPGGIVCATTPWWESVWAWQDPGHRRVYSSELLCYLNQEEYLRQIGWTAMTDYRAVWPPPFHFALTHTGMSGDNPKRAGFHFVLEKGIWGQPWPEEESK